ncbi:hypothetical protein Salat_1189300 [Sesamum alatum]|uniref:Uncharacterized protein n=1 Tax=Sesamum alatum TaxID=300844 RepID=A0AAE1YEZ1_9LAMI|nr:hypothetical protein Salat_1189300 [Sesamum alatum]
MAGSWRAALMAVPGAPPAAAVPGAQPAAPAPPAVALAVLAPPAALIEGVGTSNEDLAEITGNARNPQDLNLHRASSNSSRAFSVGIEEREKAEHRGETQQANLSDAVMELVPTGVQSLDTPPTQVADLAAPQSPITQALPSPAQRIPAPETCGDDVPATTDSTPSHTALRSPQGLEFHLCGCKTSVATVLPSPLLPCLLNFYPV